MYVVTGAAGFIGSCMVGKLNNKGIRDIVVVDDFSNPLKSINLEHKIFVLKIDRMDFNAWLTENCKDVDVVFHLGARTDTTEFDRSVFDLLNLNYSKKVWEICTRFNIPLLYASSAATYGGGEFGYDDDESRIHLLKPLNPYGESKNDFDKWVLAQENKPDFWAGFKFFNVYGPNEYHKGRMASVIFHSYNQIKNTGKVKLFRSHRPDFEDGMQLRDFIYVKDVVEVLYQMFVLKSVSGIYNLGTGKARAFLHLAQATFKAMGVEEAIEFVDTPADIRDKYQYFTEAKMEKLAAACVHYEFRSLEEGVFAYVNEYLMEGRCF
jgi:ADP-L-glycero-D-manno-heptose 6-epimerase